MADPITPSPTDQTSPSDAGHTTTEYRITQLLVWILSLLAGATVVFAGLHQAMPAVGWFATAATIVGSIGAAALLAAKFVSGRSEVKVALANLEAARAMADGKTQAAALLSGNQVLSQVAAATAQAPYRGP